MRSLYIRQNVMDSVRNDTSTEFYIGQACQTGGPPATCNSWLAVAAKLSQQPEYNSFEYERSFG